MSAGVIEKHGGHGNAAWVMNILRLTLSGIFIFAGIYKLRDPATFEVSLIHWRLFPDALLMPLVWGVPWMEIVAGWACLAKSWRQAGLWFLLFLTGLYTLLLILEWMRGVSSDCGCFGAASAHWPYYALVLRNVGLILIEIILIDSSSAWQVQTSVFSPGRGGRL
jgi:hypothetical protein